jgi:hypothetical protein
MRRRTAEQRAQARTEVWAVIERLRDEATSDAAKRRQGAAGKRERAAMQAREVNP